MVPEASQSSNMTAGIATNMRFVMCPRCRGILPESPGISVYRCGGCDAILRAKNRSTSVPNTGVASPNTGSAERNKLDHPSEDHEPRISSHEATVRPSGESSSDPNGLGDCSSEESRRINLSERQKNAGSNDESRASGESPRSENGELSDRDLSEAEVVSISSSHEATIPSSGECIIDPTDEKDQNESGDSSSEQLVRRKHKTNAENNEESHACLGELPRLRNRVCSEREFAHHENGALSGRDPEEEEEDSISGECIIDPDDKKDQKESGDNRIEQLVHIKSSEGQKNSIRKEESGDCHGEQPGCSNQGYSRFIFAHQEKGKISGRDHPKAEEPSTSNCEVITIPFSGESSLDLKERDQDENEDNSCRPLVRRRLSERKNASNDESRSCQGEQSRFSRPTEAKDASTPSHEIITIPFSGDCILDPNDEKDQKENEDSGSDHLFHMRLREHQSSASNDNGLRALQSEQSGFSHPTETEKASTSSCEVMTITLSSESILNPNEEKDQNENENSRTEQLLRMSLSERQKNANNGSKSCATEAEKASTSSHEEISIPFSSDFILNSHEERGQKENEDNRSGHLAEENASNNDESRGFHGELSEFSHFTEKKEASISKQEVITIPFSGECMETNKEKDQKQNEDSSCEKIIHRSLSDHQKNTSSEPLNQVFDAKGELSSENSSEDEILLSGEETSEAGDSKGIDARFESSGIINPIAASSSAITADTHLEARISYKTPAPPTEQVLRVNELEGITSHDFEHRRSVDNFESLEVNQCSDPRDALLGMTKARTKSFLAYYRNASSFDGTDDQFLNQRAHSSKNIHRSANFLASREGSRRGKSLMNNAVARDSKTPYESRSSGINLSKEKHYAIENHRRSQDDYRRRERERHQAKTLLLGRDSVDSFENGSTCSSMFEEFHDSRSHLSASFSDHDHDKARLLKMVYELQNQLQTSRNRIPMELSEESSWMATHYHDSEFPRYPRNHLSSRTFSSGPQINNRFHVQHFPEWHNKRDSRMAHTSYDSQSCYSSHQSSPRHSLSSQLPVRGGYSKSENLGMRERNLGIRERNLGMREKNHHGVKHLVRPMAGGAPFVTCYYCLKLLQIPAEFFLLKRRCNRLKCGNCSKILEFSLQSRTHVEKCSTANQEMEKASEEHSISSSHTFRHGEKVIKVSSENERLSTIESSPLHQLMGYASPSQVINGFDASGRRVHRKT